MSPKRKIYSLEQ
ncbi:5a379c7b-573f-46aa-be0a-743343282268 [Thermothielavioides terrestris]|uniref:5a379c7b-573f-46aa-be0a-743343282268 n=1 Tax=Thermothielavioides terrestris TaxID=2587410 RepID=A0A3S4AJX8_9PEZI|nr:5a379c7b-573f-46aa-be0a-743343282268 [Thermothielavioides terrestris]